MRKKLKFIDNKKGQLGMDVAKSFLLGLLSLLIIGVTALIVLVSLGETASVSGNTDASNVITNGTDALSTFFTSTSTWLGLLGVVILILIISVVIAVVNRFGKGSV